MATTNFIDPFNTLDTNKDQSSLLGTSASNSPFGTAATTGENIFENYAKSLGQSSIGTAAPTTPDASASADTGTAASGTGSFDIADWFARGVIVVLGFIFVAVGLNMFKPGLITVPKI